MDRGWGGGGVDILNVRNTIHNKHAPVELDLYELNNSE